MLINHDEYLKMYEAEEQLWWYKILHEKVLKAIKSAGFQKSIKILDAGCGTGGLMSFLIKNGYTDIVGFDYSESAVFFSTQRELNVQQSSIDQLPELFSENSFDVIICDDVFYALEESQIQNAFKNITKLLKSDGIFITNNNAFDCFYGIHDIAVGGKHRFTLSSILKFTQNIKLKVEYFSYWSWVLSPLILLVRQWQQLIIKFKQIDLSKVVSDVSVPAAPVNSFFYFLVKLEEKIIDKGFFVSSLFLVFKKSL